MSDDADQHGQPEPTQPIQPAQPVASGAAPGDPHAAAAAAGPGVPDQGEGTVAPRRRGLGTAAIVASVIAVVVIAGGGFAAWRFLSGGGPHPEDVLPDSTFAVVSVDLDPSGGQKIEAIKTLRKFPSFTENTGVRPDSDVVKELWDKTLAHQCKDVSYAQDLKPWLGKRVALGAVKGGSEPWPVLAVQVTDTDAARKGMAKLEACNQKSDGDFGYYVGDDYAFASDSDAHAKAIATAGQKSPLAKDAAYQKWTDKAGGAGIVNAYVAKSAVSLLRDQLGSELDSAPADTKKQLDKSLADFQGLGAIVRFDDGGLELEMAAGGDTSQFGKDTVGKHVAGLPKDTAAVLAGAVDGKALAKQLESTFSGLGEMFGSTGDNGDFDQMIEEQTGLKLPDDLVTVLGDSFSVSVGGDAPADLDQVSQPADVPVGYLVRGDDKAVKEVVDRVQQKAGFSLADLPATFDTADGKAVLASNPDYAKQLLGNGSLGDDETFKDVVPQADKSPFVFYVGLDQAWSDALAKAASSGAANAREGREYAGDVKALKAFGMSAWTDGDEGHALVRLTAR